MPHAMMKLKPGIDTQSTVALNDGMEYSSANLIRFLPDRDGQGLIQKMGGWISYYSSPITSTIRALKGWADLNSNNYLGIGAESSLAEAIIKDAVGASLTLFTVTVKFCAAIAPEESVALIAIS